MVADDDTVFPLSDLCGPPCDTLANVGKVSQLNNGALVLRFVRGDGG